MEEVLKSLNVDSMEIAPNIVLNIVNIEKIDDIIKEYIDKVLIEIYSKGHDSSIEIVKLKLKNYFSSKGQNLEIGSIAEFFVHLFLKLKKFNQECLYKNLEENSIKKGFDGFYTKDEVIWLMESKSGSILTESCSHHNNIGEAYRDLKKKVSSKTANNPWENAYSHAIQARSQIDILKKIKLLEDLYTRNTFTKIEEYNIIPSSTIFYDLSTFTKIEINELKSSLANYFKGRKYKKIELICINKKTKDLFFNYINT
jgi:hypothetical protein